MENGPLHDDKLFRAVNDRLSNYEAPQEGANWDAMSRALNQLPKTARYSFKWKISLNSILIAFGILSISILGFVWMGRDHGKDSKTSTTTIPVLQVKQNVPTTPTQNVVSTNTNITQNDASVLSENSLVSNADQITDNTNAFTHRKKKDLNTNGLYFGDQIDLRKGFIYHTQENSSLVSTHVDSIPSTYYDIVDGHRKTIHLKKDSQPLNKTTYNVDSASASNTGAPTGEDRQGFNITGN